MQKNKFRKDIILIGNNLFLRAMTISEVVEEIDCFVITFSYNPEGDNYWDFYKENMTIGEIKEFRKWVRRVGGITYSLRRANACY